MCLFVRIDQTREALKNTGKVVVWKIYYEDENGEVASPVQHVPVKPGLITSTRLQQDYKSDPDDFFS